MKMKQNIFSTGCRHHNFNVEFEHDELQHKTLRGHEFQVIKKYLKIPKKPKAILKEIALKIPKNTLKIPKKPKVRLKELFKVVNENERTPKCGHPIYTFLQPKTFQY